jgi:hypothetical protein
MMHRDGWTGPRASSAIPFAWLVWSRDHRGPPIFDRVSWDDPAQSNISPRPERTEHRDENRKRDGAQKTEGIAKMSNIIKKPAEQIPQPEAEAKLDNIAGAEPTSPAQPPDDFPDLSTLRLDQAFAETAGVKKLLTTVPVRKPNQQDWNRAHPAREYRDLLAVIELRDDREIYLLLPHIARELPGEFYSVVMHTAINRQGVIFLWPVKLPGPDGKQLEWHRSMAEAVELAMTKWVRVKANMALGAYDIYETESTIADPQWPDISFHELVRIAFRSRLVTNFDHPVIKRLRGLA